jgi:hypothetical protein
MEEGALAWWVSSPKLSMMAVATFWGICYNLPSLSLSLSLSLSHIYLYVCVYVFVDVSVFFLQSNSHDSHAKRGTWIYDLLLRIKRKRNIYHFPVAGIIIIQLYLTASLKKDFIHSQFETKHRFLYFLFFFLMIINATPKMSSPQRML